MTNYALYRYYSLKMQLCYRKKELLNVALLKDISMQSPKTIYLTPLMLRESMWFT